MQAENLQLVMFLELTSLFLSLAIRLLVVSFRFACRSLTDQLGLDPSQISSSHTFDTHIVLFLVKMRQLWSC